MDVFPMVGSIRVLGAFWLCCSPCRGHELSPLPTPAANCRNVTAARFVALRWDDVDFRAGKLHVRRSKGGVASVHPIGGRELRALRRLQREGQPGLYVFTSERLAPLSVAGYQRMVARAGRQPAFR